MTRTVQLSLTSTETKPLPEGKVFAGFRFGLAAPGGTPNTEVTQDSVVTFGGVPFGTYTASVVAIDQDGNELSAPVVLEVLVAEVSPPPTFEAPVALAALVF